MKKLLLSLWLVLILSGCEGTSAAPPPENSAGVPGPFPGLTTYADSGQLDESGKVQVKTEHGVYGPDVDKIAYLVTNNTSMTKSADRYHEVEYFYEGQWHRVDMTGGHGSSSGIRRFSSQAYYVDMSLTQFRWRPGLYRLVKPVDGSRCAAYFELGESPITKATPYGYAPLADLPLIYSQTDAARDGVMVVDDTGFVLSGSELFPAFLERVELGLPCCLRVMQLNRMGDPVISDIIYESYMSHTREQYTLVTDSTRDRLAKGGLAEPRYFSFLCVFTRGRDTEIVLSDYASQGDFPAGYQPFPLLINPADQRSPALKGVEKQVESLLERSPNHALLGRVFYRDSAAWAKLEEGEAPAFSYQLDYWGATRYLHQEGVTALTEIRWLDQDTLGITGETAEDGVLFFSLFDVKEGVFTASCFGRFLTLAEGPQWALLLSDGGVTDVWGNVLYSFDDFADAALVEGIRLEKGTVTLTMAQGEDIFFALDNAAP